MKTDRRALLTGTLAVTIGAAAAAVAGPIGSPAPGADRDDDLAALEFLQNVEFDADPLFVDREKAKQVCERNLQHLCVSTRIAILTLGESKSGLTDKIETMGSTCAIEVAEMLRQAEELTGLLSDVIESAQYRFMAAWASADLDDQDPTTPPAASAGRV